MTDICRLCAAIKPIERLVQIDEPNFNLKIKLEKCLQLDITIKTIINDLLPQNICNDCILCLNQSYEFLEKVNQAQETLKRAFIIDIDNCRFRKDVHLFATGDLSHTVRSVINSLCRKGYTNEEIIDKLNLNRNYFDGLEKKSTKTPVETSNQSELPVNCTNREDKQTDKLTHNVSVITSAKIYMKSIDMSDTNPTVNEEIKVDNVIDKKYADFDKDQLEIKSEIIPIALHQEPITEYNNDKSISIYDDNDNEHDSYSDSNNSYLNNLEYLDEVQSEQPVTSKYSLNLLESDKNTDGTVNEFGLRKLCDSWINYQWLCIECKLNFPNNMELRTHFTTEHSSIKIRYSCFNCHKIFTRYYTLLKHITLRHHPQLKYCCDICNVYFWKLTALRKHRCSHFDSVRIFLCQVCGKEFRSKNTLSVHCRSHLPTEIKNKYSCEICTKKFGSKANLVTHQRIHSGVRDFTCDQCGKSFIQRGNLENHLVTHLFNKPFKCDDCHKCFKTQVRLIKHTKIHSIVKPHKCDICNRQFREKSTLKEHIRIHTGVMPYTCEFCNKKFRFKGILTTHRRQHTGERPYSCNECNHHFTNWSNYNKHMKRKHGVNTSVSVRKPQTIPPTGMPESAKQSIIIPTNLVSDIEVSAIASVMCNVKLLDGDGNAFINNSSVIEANNQNSKPPSESQLTTAVKMN